MHQECNAKRLDPGLFHLLSSQLLPIERRRPQLHLISHRYSSVDHDWYHHRCIRHRDCPGYNFGIADTGPSAEDLELGTWEVWGRSSMIHAMLWR